MSCNRNLTPQNLALRAPFDAARGGYSSANREKGEARLGSTAKSVGRSPHQQARIDRFRHQRHAAKLLKFKERVGLCKSAPISTANGVGVVMSEYGEGDSSERRASFSGLQTCGSVWHCPVCSARISEVRRGEMNELLAWARANEYQPVMLTLTARHGRDDELVDLLEDMKWAKKKLHQHRAWRRIKDQIIGSVTATEVTGGGANGWHPHFHMIVIVEPGTDLEELRQPWLASLRGVGLDGSGAAFQLQDASQAQRYITKWGAAEEMTLSAKKKGRAGRTPAQLLAASSDEGDREAGMLWAEYARTFKGRRQLQWSRGLKAMAGVEEVADEEAALDDVQEDQQVDEPIMISLEEWRGTYLKKGAVRRRGLILNAAENGGEAAVRAIVRADGCDPGPEDVSLIEDDPPPEGGPGNVR